MSDLVFDQFFGVEIKRCPKITVVTPSFNQADFLDEAIQSVKNQRYPNVEHIVMDGGSTDHSVDVIKKHEADLAYWVSEKDRGQAHAINKGLERATGEIFTYLNSDDVFLPGAFNAVIYEYLRDPSLAWVSGTQVKFGTLFHRLDPPIERGISPRKEDWLIASWVLAPSCFVKLETMRQCGPFTEDLHFAFDYEYWTRLAFADVQLKQIARPLQGYRLHDSSKTVTLQEKFREDEKRIRDLYLPKLSSAERSRFERGFRQLSDARRFTEVDTAVRNRDRTEAMRLLKQLVRSEPRLMISRATLGALKRILSI